MRRVAIVVALPLLLGFEPLKRANRAVEEGNARLKAGKADEALQRYDEAARALPAEPGVHFDRGAALAALERHDEAAQAFLRATEAKDGRLKQAAFYNLGNTFARAEKYTEAIEAYKRALALDPTDVRAKWNLELALKKKKDADAKNQQQGSNSDQQKQKDDGAGKDQRQPQGSKDDQKEKDGKDQQGKQPPAEQKSDRNDDAPPAPRESPQPGGDKGAEMREMDAVLDSLERSPKDLEKYRAKVRSIRRRAPEKDW